MYLHEMPASQKRKVAHMTFSVPDSVKRRAQARRDVNWSAVVTKSIKDRLRALEFMDRVLADSRLTQADVDELADAVDTAMARKLGLLK